ncbi:unnamed protein product, partial [Cyprideis torosa]
ALNFNIVLGYNEEWRIGEDDDGQHVKEEDSGVQETTSRRREWDHKEPLLEKCWRKEKVVPSTEGGSEWRGGSEIFQPYGQRKDSKCLDPLISLRAPCGFVGLKNPSSLCYMNSVIQQLFMMPGFKEAVLTVDGEKLESDNFFVQFQLVLANLMESEKQYYEPSALWSCFKLHGRPIQISEQQDAFEFFTDLADQIDEFLSKKRKPKIFQRKFEGIFSDTTSYIGCEHRYEREEAFMALNLPVRAGSLTAALEHFVKGEIMEGANACYCDQCGVKRRARKRMCIKTLPQVIVIQLKRFFFDHETRQAIKFDDYFEFPAMIDMGPYTKEGVEYLDDYELDFTSSTPVTTPTPSEKRKISFTSSLNRSASGSALLRPATLPPESSKMYEFVGTIVHSGQCMAGHYYSYVMDRRARGDSMSSQLETVRPKWIKFNDHVVEPVDVNEEFMRSEMFGGTMQVNTGNGGGSEVRSRHWNSYLLFYERVGESGGVSQSQAVQCGSSDPLSTPPVSPSSSSKAGGGGGFVLRTPPNTRPTPNRSTATRTTPPSIATTRSKLRQQRFSTGGLKSPKSPLTPNASSPRRDSDGLTQLQMLVNHGEKRGLFEDLIPGPIQRSVQEDNLAFTRNRGILEENYYIFIEDVCDIGFQNGSSPIPSLRLGLLFLLNTYLHQRGREASRLEAWMRFMLDVFDSRPEAPQWLLEFLTSHEGEKYLKLFLLECPEVDVRQFFAGVLEHALVYFVSKHNMPLDTPCLKNLLCCLLSLLDKDVGASVKTSGQFLSLLYAYSNISTVVVSQLLSLGLYASLLRVLCGPAVIPSDVHTSMDQEDIYVPRTPPNHGPIPKISRFWTSSQSREISVAHLLLSRIWMVSDLGPLQDADDGEIILPAEVLVKPPPLVPLSLSDRRIFCPVIHEMVSSVAENPSHGRELLQTALVRLANRHMEGSKIILAEIMHQIGTEPASELRQLFDLLAQILALQDAVLHQRLSWVLDGIPENPCYSGEGLLSLIRKHHEEDPQRSYQCIKFLVCLATRQPLAKDLLASSSDSWNWSVNWLRKKMEDSLRPDNVDSGVSNEATIGKGFQRTVSAQATLAEATAMFDCSNLDFEMEIDEAPSLEEQSDDSSTFRILPGADSPPSPGNKEANRNKASVSSVRFDLL